LKAKLETSDWVSLAILGGTTALTVGLFSSLPARVPTHFDIHGVANGWMPRSAGAGVLPLTALGVWGLLRPGARLLPAAWHGRVQQSATGVLAALLVAFLSALQCIVLYAALLRPPSVGFALALLLGGFWIALGLVFPRIRRNPWMGIRTPWTLSSDENWAKTHRFAGFTFSIGGVAALLCAAVGASALSVPIILASALAPALYSSLLARRLPPEA
jgi:uncharacterized membrane protein